MATSISSTVTGIAGFDVKAAVDGLLAFPKLEISQAQKKQDAQTAKQDAFAAINNAMLAFKSTATAMADSGAFFSYAASLGSSSSAVSASSLLDVTGTDSVSAGKHNIIVQKIAQAERVSSSVAVKDSTGTAATSDISALNLTGTFKIGTASITVLAGDTLQDIAASINQQNKGASGTGVSASVLKVANNDFRLVLASDTTGAAGFALSGADLDFGGVLAGLQIGAVGQTNARQSLQTPQDAQVSIDGLTLTRSSNSISDALNGVTLNLKQADPNVTVNMDISIDTGALVANVQSFVDAYNQVQSLVNKQFVFDPNTNTTGVLAGESVLTSIQSTLANSLLQTIPGLATDRNSMVMVGIEPDAKGQLVINNARFDNFINTDPTAIRDVFVANGQSSNSQLQFLTTGLHTPSGTYQVNVTQAASKAAVLGTTNLTAGLGAAEAITFTDIASGRQAIANLILGQSQTSIVSALNTEFDAVYTELHQTSGSLGASGVTTSSTLSSLGFGVIAGDRISISGTNRLGAAVSSSFSVLDPAVDTVGTLLASIQTAFDQQVVASLDTAGHIQITDAQSGDSLLTVNLTADNKGGGMLNLGTDNIITEGRYAMNLVALAQGNGVSIEAKSFGTSSDFSVAQTVNGLGIANNTYNGSSIVGTINGAIARGSGQLLIGTSGNIDGLGVFYTGTATGAIGDITLGVGLGAKMEGILDLFSNPFTGLIQGSITSSQFTFDDLTKKITDLETQMEQQRVSLIKSFTLMQTTMATLQGTGNFLTAQLNARNSNN
ncbi:MAG: flagellar filament capping protein FliD [Mariprofundaceae bacterium]|nr:flagellar filament capping protein FliD [Mariprofundaceae bacterium]